MEGVGSTRLGRASARYGGSTAVFNGPVRRWKKKWVHVSASSSSTAKHPHSNGNGSAASSILLCKWTPISFADSGSSAAVEGEDEEHPPKRKFRYTPVAVLEEERKRAAVKQVEEEANTDEIKTNQSPNWVSSKTDNDLDMNEISKKETQDSSMGNLDLGLCLKDGHDDSRNSVGENVGKEKAASSTGFWAKGGN